MKQFKKIGLLLAAFMLGIFSVWAQKPIKTLVVTGQNNHNWPVSHIAIQKILEKNDAGLRKQSGTTLKNAATEEIVYTPPQEYDAIIKLMSNLEQIINDDGNWPDIDPLIKMAVLHYQFESIHPFYDGNGRTSRLLTSLLLYRIDCFVGKYISLEKLIEENKEGYYETLQQSSYNWREDQHTYVPFVEYFLKIILTAYRKYFSLLNLKKSSVATDDISN